MKSWRRTKGGPLGPPFALVMDRWRSSGTLESEPQAEAHLALAERTKDSHEVAAGHVAGGHPAKVRGVGQVVELSAEGRVDPLGDLESAVDHQVGIPDPGVAQDIAARGAEADVGHRLKRGRVEIVRIRPDAAQPRRWPHLVGRL